MDSLLSIRSSEDELENEGVGRRKKRRSGSLNSKSNRKHCIIIQLACACVSVLPLVHTLI